VTIHGRTDLHFPYVPSHLSYMLLELLKNSMRATIETHGTDNMPPIKIVIADGEANEDVSDSIIHCYSIVWCCRYCHVSCCVCFSEGGLASFHKTPCSSVKVILMLIAPIFMSHFPPKVVIKVSDEGGGISRSNMERIWSYLYTTADPRVLDRMLGDDNGEIKVSFSCLFICNLHSGVDHYGQNLQQARAE